MEQSMSTATTPTSPSDEMRHIGFWNVSKITDTLQGNIWRGTRRSTTSVIKATNKTLYENAKGFVDGVAYSIEENIVREQSILKYLTRKKRCSDTIVKYNGFYESAACYYLVMEDGGGSLFAFVERAHKLIQEGNIDLHHWKEIIRVIARQMIESVHYIHDKNVCHFDISLENFLINDVHIRVHRAIGQKDKIMFDVNDIRIKLCDFGLAQHFKTIRCKSDRYCGKTNYKSPEMFSSKEYDAKKNDIWSLGVSLFMLISGTCPWSAAKRTNDAFRYVLKYSLSKLLKMWKISSYFDDELLYLLYAIFQYEDKRISIEKMKHYIDEYL